MKENVSKILIERERTITSLKNLNGIEEVYPSDANFILFKVKNALDIYKLLAQQGVIVRYRGNELTVNIV